MAKFYSFSDDKFVTKSTFEDLMVEKSEGSVNLIELLSDPRTESEIVKQNHYIDFSSWIKDWSSNKGVVLYQLESLPKKLVHGMRKFLAAPDECVTKIKDGVDRIIKYIDNFYVALENFMGEDDLDQALRQSMTTTLEQMINYLQSTDFFKVTDQFREGVVGLTSEMECDLLEFLLKIDLVSLKPFHQIWQTAKSKKCGTRIANVRQHLDGRMYKKVLSDVKSEYINYAFWKYAEQELSRIKDIIESSRGASRVLRNLQFVRNASVNDIVYHNLFLQGLNKHFPELYYLLKMNNEL